MRETNYRGTNLITPKYRRIVISHLLALVLKVIGMHGGCIIIYICPPYHSCLQTFVSSLPNGLHNLQIIENGTHKPKYKSVED